MLNNKPPDYHYCPFCSSSLEEKKDADGKKRMFCPKDNWTYYPYVYIAVHAVIIRGGEVLLVQRRRNPNKDKWQLPAGFIEYGEHPEEALKREVKEETGLDVTNYKYLEILQAEDDPRAKIHLRIFYEVKFKGEVEIGDKAENKQIAWFDTKKLPEMAWEQHRQIIKKL